MKKFLFLASSILLLLAASCQKEEPVNPNDSNNPSEITPETSLVEGLAFMNSEYAVHQYDTIGIKQDLRIFPANIASKVTVKFQSSDPSVATVNAKGQVIGVREGEVHILASANGKEAKCKVFVRPFSTIANFQETVNGVSFTMIAVEGGTFQMGATAEQGDDAESNEKPVHAVSLSSFYLSETEVTQAQYQAIMGGNPSRMIGDNLPVECVSFTYAQDFCNQLSQLTGKNYVLPTEAQWEYAARGGKYHEGTKYAGSNNVDEVAWYGGNSNDQTHPVATKAPNALGLYDMSGNVWEWCLDWYSKYPAEAQINPMSQRGDSRVIRGGGWSGNVMYTRVSCRSSCTPSGINTSYGFRVALLP